MPFPKSTTYPGASQYPSDALDRQFLYGFSDDEVNFEDFAASVADPTGANAARIMVGHDEVGLARTDAAVAACQTAGMQVIVCLWTVTDFTDMSPTDPAGYYAGRVTAALNRYPNILIEGPNEPNFAGGFIPGYEFSPGTLAECMAAAIAVAGPNKVIGPAIAALPDEATYFAWQDALYFSLQQYAEWFDLYGVATHIYPDDMPPGLYAEEYERHIARAAIWGKPVYVTETNFDRLRYGGFQPGVAVATFNRYYNDPRVAGLFFYRLAEQQPSARPEEGFGAAGYVIATNTPLRTALTTAFGAPPAPQPTVVLEPALGSTSAALVLTTGVPPVGGVVGPGGTWPLIYVSAADSYPSEFLAPGVVVFRDRPPIRLSYDVATPNGKHYRWGGDEGAENAPSGVTFSTTMPGGFEAFEATLPRKPGVTYSDLERLSTIRALGPGGEVAGEYRLERTPRTSGTGSSVSIQAVGWQAHLEDDQSAKMIYVDRDLGRWGSMSSTLAQGLIAFGIRPLDGSVGTDTRLGPTFGIPNLNLSMDDADARTRYCYLVYDATAGLAIGFIDYAFIRGTNTSGFFDSRVATSTSDGFGTVTQTANLASSGGSVGTLTAGADERFGRVSLTLGPGGAASTLYDVSFFPIVWGDHGLIKHQDPTDLQYGVFASDVIADALGRFAPRLNYSVNGTISPTGYPIKHLSFTDPTTAADILTQSNRFHIWDWAVWNNQTFYFHERGTRGNSWRARIGPSQLSETGPQVDRMWNGCIVKYSDVDGTGKTVGPPGATTDNTDAVLLDTDPLNPANELGVRRWTTLDMGGVSTLAGATEVGRRFLQEAKALDSSGQATLTGYVEDSHGVTWPAWKVRAGDDIVFVDAADTSPRRIVKTSWSDDAKTLSLDLDSPPEGLDSLLERFGVELVGLGL